MTTSSTTQRDFLRRLLVACAPLLTWGLHFVALYAVMSVVPATATCAPGGVQLSVWLATVAAVLAIAASTRHAVTWHGGQARELRLVRIAAVANAVLALTAVVWSAASVVLQVRWCP